MDVLLLEEEVEECRVVHGERGPRRGDSRGIRGEAVHIGTGPAGVWCLLF